MIQRASERRTDKSTQREHEWAVILAGSDGTRLKCLTRRIAGDERPKQFCSLMGGATLVEETQQRVAMEMAGEQRCTWSIGCTRSITNRSCPTRQKIW